jgi:hypothetical protein
MENNAENRWIILHRTNGEYCTDEIGNITLIRKGILHRTDREYSTDLEFCTANMENIAHR